MELWKVPNGKMLLAPILAITLALLLTGAIYYSPLPSTITQTGVKASPQPQPTRTMNAAPSITPSEGPQGDYEISSVSPPSTDKAAEASPAPSLAVPATVSSAEVPNVLPFVFIAAAAVVAVVVVAVFFSERNLNKEE